jgi:probable rRNA maturation factor
MTATAATYIREVQNVNQSSDESASGTGRFHIEFFFDQVDPDFVTAAELEKLRSAILATLERQRVGQAEISVAIVSGDRMRQLNNQYLQHDYDTDVLSFCLEEEEELGFMLGQLVVSLDFARSQIAALAQQGTAQVDLIDELALYLVHGTLHLVGYDDHDDAGRLQMRTAESDVLRTLGIEPVWLADGNDHSTGLREQPGDETPVDTAERLT